MIARKFSKNMRTKWCTNFSFFIPLFLDCLRTPKIITLSKWNFTLTIHDDERINSIALHLTNEFSDRNFLSQLRETNVHFFSYSFGFVHVSIWNFHLIAGFELLSTCIIPSKDSLCVFIFQHVHDARTHAQAPIAHTIQSNVQFLLTLYSVARVLPTSIVLLWL